MHGPLTPPENNNLAMLPFITRTRNQYLYDSTGTRWTDFWLDGGSFLMGHRPAGLGKRLKNELDRGLYPPYPGYWKTRLEKSLLRLFPGYATVRLYPNSEQAFTQLKLDNPPLDPLDLPVIHDKTDNKNDAAHHPAPFKALWGRPLLPNHPGAELLFPILPSASISPIQPVLFTPSATLATDHPDNTHHTPLALAALTRAALMCQSPNISTPTDITPEKLVLWQQKGPYFMYQGPPTSYPQLFTAMIARRILIAPSPHRPCIVLPTLTQKELNTFLTGGTP